MTPRLAPDTAAVVHLPVEVRGLPQVPPPGLDPYLDAAVRCFVRYGVGRTSVQDVAAEMKVNRTTVYRQVGNMDSLIRLVNARAINRIVEEAFRRTEFAAISAGTVVDLLADLIEMVRSDPVIEKVLGDEMDLVGTLLEDLPAMIERVTSAVAPALEAAMGAGKLAGRDAPAVAEWMARIGGSCIIAPPPGDLRAFLSEVLVPALDPGGLQTAGAS